MANTIQHKRSSTSGATPAASGLSQGELAINIADGKLYTKNNSNTVINLGVTSISGTYITPSSGNFFNYLAVNGVPVSVSGHSHESVPQAESLVTTVFNETGSSISKMTAVYINGGHGDRPTIQKAIATADATSAGTYGLTYETIGINQEGRVIVFGALSGLNTDQFNPTAPTGDVNGTVVYLSPTVSGGLTTTKPYAPNHIVALGVITRTHQNEGVIEVRVQNGFELEELHNVAISGVSNGQFLQYNSGSELWVPSSSGNFTALSINGNSNIVTGTGVANHVAYWNSSSGIVADSGQLYWDATNNRLGIGTSNPQELIHISGSISSSTGNLFRLNNSNSTTNPSINFRIGGVGNYDNHFFISRNGTDVFGIDTNNRGLFLASFALNGNQQFFSYNNANASIKLQNTTTNNLEISAVSGILFQSQLSTKMTMDKDGNFGIGTASPSYLLDVNGTIGVSGIARFNNDIYMLDNTKRISWDNGTEYIGRQGDSIIIGTQSTNRILVNSAGNVGIGTDSPSDKLNVVGNISAGTVSNTQGKFIAYGSAGQPNLVFEGFDASGTARISTNSGFNRQLKIENDGASTALGVYIEGDVGIGTSSPDARLVVNGNAYAVGTFGVGAACRANLSADLGGAAGLSWNDGSFVGMQYLDGANYRLGLTLHATARETRVQTKTADNAGIITFYPRAGTTEVARFHSNNNFGIGTTAPTSPLHVAGSIDAGSVGSTGVSIQTSHFSTTTNGLTNTALYINPTFSTSNSNVANTYGLLISPRNSGQYTTTNSYGLYVNASTLVTGVITNNYAATFMGGNVGIGTASPSYLLDINGTTRSSIFRAGAGTTDALILQSNGTGSSSRTITLQPRSLGGSRTIHIPDANADVALTYNGNAVAAGSTVNQSMSTIRNNLGDPSVEESALFHGEFYNQLRFISPSLQEESADGGTTWTTSTRMSAANLGDLMIGEGQGTSVNILPQGSSSPIAYRLTWDTATNPFGNPYFWLNHLYIYCSTNNNTVTFTVDAFHNTNGWTQIFTGTGSNWPGHISIKHNTIAYYSSNASFYGKVRITFTSTTVSQPVTLNNIEWFGGYPTGRRNVQYYDRNKNVYFPSLVYTSGIYSTTRNYYRSSNGHEFRNSNDATIALLNNNGYFGINTSSPSTYLHISNQVTDFGSIFCSGSTTSTVIGLGNSDTVPFLATLSPGNLSTSVYGFGMFYRSTDGNFQIRRKGGSTSWSDVLTIDRSNGNISINGNNPLQKLDVRGNVYASGNVGINISSASAPLEVAATATTNVDIAHFSNSNGVEKAKFSLSSAGDGTFSLIDAGNITDIFLSSNSTANSYINNGGNFGVGTNLPFTKFNVGAKATTDNSYVYDFHSVVISHPSGVDTINDMKELLVLSREGYVGRAAAASFKIGRFEAVGTPPNRHSRTRLDLVLAHDSSYLTTPTTVLTALSNGNVGIGTTTPSGQLHVVGTGIISSRLGINTNSPSHNLQVNGTSRTDTLLVNRSSSASAGLVSPRASISGALYTDALYSENNYVYGSLLGDPADWHQGLTTDISFEDINNITYTLSFVNGILVNWDAT